MLPPPHGYTTGMNNGVTNVTGVTRITGSIMNPSPSPSPNLNANIELDWKGTDIDDLTDTITRMLKRGVSHRQIMQSVRTAVFNASDDLPRVPILYNACRGDFHTSEMFNEYFFQEHSDCRTIDWTLLRVYQARCIVPFGHIVARDFPLVFSVLRCATNADTYLKVSDIVQCASEVLNQQVTLDAFQRNIEVLDDVIQNPWNASSSMLGKKPTVALLMQHDMPWLFGYPKAVLEDFRSTTDLVAIKTSMQVALDEARRRLDELWSAATSDVPGCDGCDGGGSHGCNPLETSEWVIGHVSDWHAASSPSYRNVLVPAFIDHVREHGESDPRAWALQRYFDPCTIALIHKTLRMWAKSPVLDESVLEIAGIVGASGHGADLRVARMPAMACWTITEQYGLERVVLA